MTPAANPDPRAALGRALAETHLEVQAAEHDYRRTLNEGRDHMMSRYPAGMLAAHPGAVDHFAWHHEAMAEATERGGLGEVPGLPFVPYTEPTAPGSAE